MSKPAEHSILMNGEMVRAIREGRKTQTRRVVKLNHAGRVKAVGSPKNWHLDDPDAVLACPYGVPGDRLWARETFFYDWEHARVFYRADADEDGSVPYMVDGAGGFGGGVGNANIDKWKPSIHMPRRLCRILLEVVSVRVERVQEISEDDAMAEGVLEYGWEDGIPGGPVCTSHVARLGFESMWQDIYYNRGYGWDVNPHVWVVEFKVIEGSAA